MAQPAHSLNYQEEAGTVISSLKYPTTQILPPLFPFNVLYILATSNSIQGCQVIAVMKQVVHEVDIKIAHLNIGWRKNREPLILAKETAIFNKIDMFESRLDSCF